MNHLMTAGDYWHRIVMPDVREYRQQFSSVRRFFHAANSLNNTMDWVLNTYKDRSPQRCLNAKTRKDYLRKLKDEEPEHFEYFSILIDVANASKHFKLIFGQAAFDTATSIQTNRSGASLGVLVGGSLVDAPLVGDVPASIEVDTNDGQRFYGPKLIEESWSLWQSQDSKRNLFSTEISTRSK